MIRFPITSDRRALLDALRAVKGVIDVVLAEDEGLVIAEDAAITDVRAVLAFPPPAREASEKKLHTIEVVYDGEDLDDVARAIGGTREEVIAIHTAPTYEVAMLGFMPGFAYLRGGDPRLDLPRRAPRTRVPQGALGIAAGYTGIYPFASAGGWNLVGRVAGFEAFDEKGAALAIGDRVRFAPGKRTSKRSTTTAKIAATAPCIEITRLAGFAIVVDRGRRGHMHEGVPWSGPLVPHAFARANHAAGNDDGDAAIELAGTIEIRAKGDVTVADDVIGARALRDGETHVIETRGARVRYLAVGGGIDTPPVLGSRTTLLVAGFGRALQRGDSFSAKRTEPRELRNGVIDGSPIGVIGDVDGTYRISPQSNRTGTRLEGKPIAIPTESLRRRSIPMTLGAIEATPSGLVVLGPDHPTTGGYPLVGVIPPADLARFFSRPLGAHVDLHTIPAIRLDGDGDHH